MTFRRVGTNYVLRLFKGEEIVTTLVDFMKKYGITAGSITGIGAISNVTIGFFNCNTKEYIKKTFNENFEILNLTGNVTLIDSEPFVHLHIILGDKDLNVKGGHLFSGTISVTGEIFLNALDTLIPRMFDNETQLKLMKL